MDDNNFHNNSEDEDVSLDQLREAYAKIAGRPAKHAETINDTESSDAWGSSSRSASTDPAAEAFSHHQSKSRSTEIQVVLADDDAGCTINPQTIIEAILFIGTPPDEKLTAPKIASMLRDVTPNEVLKIVDELNARYKADEAVYRIKNHDDALYLEMEDSMIPFQQEFFGKNRAIKLNPTSIEVLALVAYNQPTTRDQIDNLRKRPSGAILNQLVRRGLLAIAPRENQSGPQSYVTTDKFLNFFHLTDLSDLPQSHEVGDIDELMD